MSTLFRFMISLFLLFAFLASTGTAAETLTVTFTSTDAGGNYGNNHIIAVWIETNTGTFVKTIGDWSATRRSSLVQWRAKAGTSDADAVLGATRTSYVSRTTTWDMTQKSGGTAIDGIYKVWFETVNANLTSANAGTTSITGANRTSVSFNKDGNASIVGPISQDKYTNITLNYSGRVAAPPSFTTQPASQTVTAGASAPFTIAASNATSYQWKRGGADIPGETATGYTLNPTAFPADNGAVFTCVATGAGGSTTSNTALLTVNAAAPSITGHPTAQSALVGGTATFTVTATSAVAMTYQWKVSTTGVGGTYNNVTGGTGGTSANYTTPVTVIGDNGKYYRCVVTNNSNGALATTSGTALLTVSSGVTAPSITVQPVSIARLDGQTAAFSITATGAPLYFQWKRNGSNVVGATSSAYSFTCTLAANNGDSYTCVVSNSANGLTNPVTSSVAVLTVTAAPPGIAVQPVNRAIGENQSVTISLTATGSPTLHYQWKRGATNVGTDANSYTFTAQMADNGAQFTCTVSNGGGSLISNTVTLTVIALPQITTQPVATQVAVGTDAFFTIAATGTGLTFQWKRNGANIVGATGATCVFTTSVGNDGDAFTCVVSNIAGSVNSTSATLSIFSPPVISSQPVDLTVDSGASASFTVVAAGTAPLTYQWQKNDLAIVGATSATYAIAAAKLADVGNYSCVVSNAYGSVITTVAALLVHAPAAPFTLSFKTISAGGSYAPKNVVAVWIESLDGVLLKSLGTWSADRRSSLASWLAKSPTAQDVTDATMGATRSDHGSTLTVTWDLVPIGATTPITDGSYKVFIEVAESNPGTGASIGSQTFAVTGGTVAPTGPIDLPGVSGLTINQTSSALADNPEPGGCGVGSVYALILLFAFLGLCRTLR